MAQAGNQLDHHLPGFAQAGLAPGGTAVLHPQKVRHHEDSKPDGGKRADGAGAFFGVWIKAEYRVKSDNGFAAVPQFGQENKHKDQRYQTAPIADGCARAGYASDLFVVSEGWKIGICKIQC